MLGPMSDFYVQWVPVEKTFVPDEDAQRRAVKLARTLFPDADHVGARVSAGVEFVDSGEMGDIACPRCGAALEDWWGEAMSAAAEGGFLDLSATAPCCGETVALDALAYEMPIAFGRFVIEILSPNREPTPADQAQLESILSSPLKLVFAHI